MSRQISDCDLWGVNERLQCFLEGKDLQRKKKKISIYREESVCTSAYRLLGL
jgi:hypothetical protein